MSDKKETRKKRRGDRKDAYLVRDLDAMHAIMPYILPNRADNEAVLAENFDMTKVIEYINKKNEGEPEFKYTFFHFITAAMAKTIVLRPKLNRFYSGHRLYERKDIIMAFTAKKKFTDSSEEVLVTLKVDRDSDVPPIEQVYERVKKAVYSFRKSDDKDDATDTMEIFLKLPRWLLRFTIKVLDWLEYHGWYPNAVMKVDPYYSTVYISNLGSIKMSADYHHLTNHGTNSVFVIIGEKKPMPFYDEHGNTEVKDGLKISLTIDERIADGFYCAKSVKLLKKIFDNPELIERPITEEIEF